jgi:thymidylate synthase
MNNVDKEYFRLLNTIITHGKRKKNRTGVDTIGVFGEQAKFNIDLDAFPILTTKKVFFKGILHELLWFIKGDTNIKYLVDNDVHIWDEWAYKRYLDKNGAEVINTQEEFIKTIKEDAEFAKQWGELGEGTYGGMWRAFPTNIIDYDYPVLDTLPPQYTYKVVDQLKKVVDKLQTNPDDRRMIVSAWHPYWVDHCALPPCHCLFHFNTEELGDWERSWIAQKRGFNIGMTSVHEMNEREFDKVGIPRRRLNCLLYQRSCDTFLGVPFNITSYCLLTAMIAHCVNMVPGVFTHTYGDLHIYENHAEQVKTQLSRKPKELPRLWINPDKRDLFSLTYDDIRLENYDPHPAIKAEVAV